MGVAMFKLNIYKNKWLAKFCLHIRVLLSWALLPSPVIIAAQHIHTKLSGFKFGWARKLGRIFLASFILDFSVNIVRWRWCWRCCFQRLPIGRGHVGFLMPRQHWSIQWFPCHHRAASLEFQPGRVSLSALHKLV